VDSPAATVAPTRSRRVTPTNCRPRRERLLNDAATFGDGQLVVLSGGDPLARDDLLELVSYGDDQGLRMTITPSGTQSLTADRIEDLADAGIRRMALSLDGATRESHDRFRGEESFESTLEAAEAASEAGLPLQINTTVCAETVDELPAIRDRVRTSALSSGACSSSSPSAEGGSWSRSHRSVLKM